MPITAKKQFEQETAHVKAVLAEYRLAEELAERHQLIERALDEHQDEIFEIAEDGIHDKVRSLRMRAQRAEEQLEQVSSRLAKAEAQLKVFQLREAAAKPAPKLTAAQKRVEVWKLKNELRQAYEQIERLRSIHAESTSK